MVLPFQINGATVVIPGIYDTLRVQDSLPAPAPAGRSVLVIGESLEGIPSALLDLTKNFFTTYESVQDFYKSGPIVDAARQLFSNQPGAAFGGSVARLYVWKSNQTTNASKPITSPTNFGAIAAARYGEAGNFIKSQIQTGQSEVKPAVTFAYLPTSAARSLKLSVNGVLSAAANVASNGAGSALVTAINGASAGVTASGGTDRAAIVSGPATSSLSSPSAGVLVITNSVGTWSATIAAGDVCYLEPGGAYAGASNANAGAYLVTARTSTVLTLRRLKSVNGTTEVNSIAFDLTAVASATAADLVVNAPVTLTQTSAPATGAAASLELVPQGSPEDWANGSFYQDGNQLDILSANTAAVAKLSATVPATNQLQVTISGGSWLKTPKVGDVVRIPESSGLASGALANADAYVVVSASSQSLTLLSCFGTTTVAVAAYSVNAAANQLTTNASFTTGSQAGERIDSSSERTAWVNASRSTDGAAFPSTRVGGRTALAMSYWDGTTTAASVSIDQNRVMTITFTGGPTPIVLNTKKYATLSDLAAYLNTVTGMTASVPDPRRQSESPKVLDMVTSVGILSGTSTPALNGKIKSDYADWLTLFSNNTGFISFVESAALVLKAGLPAAEATAGFLAGAHVGSTAQADIQSGFDAGLKVDTRIVIPLFSRDANKDVDDGLTDDSSSYTIDAVHAAAKAHAATASGTEIRRERFCVVSHYGSFQDSQLKAGALGYERLQMTFQLCRATASDGTLQWFLPWMTACAISAGRAQAVAATPMLRKSFNMLDVKHIGDTSLYDDSLLVDFDPESTSDLSAAITSGLLAFKLVSGSGVQLLSPDLSTRSRQNDPQGWVYERVNVLFGLDEVRQTLRSVLDNLIGNRTTDVSTTDVRKLTADTLNSFQNAGVLVKSAITDIQNLGNGYSVFVDLFPPEALEFIGITETAKRTVS